MELARVPVDIRICNPHCDLDGRVIFENLFASFPCKPC